MILCPKCGTRTGVYDSRISFEGYTRRKRLCPQCDHRFATIEVLDIARPLERKNQKAQVEQKPQPAKRPKKVAPKREVVRKARQREEIEDDDADSFTNDFYEVARDLGIGGLDNYD
jgi:transcriptional regulator NrdR family protein